MSEHRTYQEVQLQEVLNDPAFGLQVLTALQMLDYEDSLPPEMWESCKDFLDIWGIVDLY